MIFDLLRLVLVSKAQTSIFGQEFSDLSREDALRRAMRPKEPLPFAYRNQLYFYTPALLSDDEIHFKSNGLIGGKVGRKRTAHEYAEPEQGFSEVDRTQWMAAYIIVDPSSHEDGQKIAFESTSDVGQPLGLCQALFKEINNMGDWPYIFEVNAIAEPESFWEFERKNKGNITEITFELIAPNMFGTRHQIDKDMSDLRDHEKSVQTTLSLKNPAGLSLDTKRVHETVSYSLEGGGKVKARSRGRRKRYNSEDQIKKVELMEDKSIPNRTVSAIIDGLIGRVFNRE